MYMYDKNGNKIQMEGFELDRTRMGIPTWFWMIILLCIFVVIVCLVCVCKVKVKSN